MAETPDQIRRHIAVLEEFERKFDAFIDETGSGQLSPDWPERRRELSKLAVRADRAMKASGVGQAVLTHPAVIGGGIKAEDLPSQIFDFGPVGLDESQFAFQHVILERIPAQVAGLEVKLEDAGSAQQAPHASPAVSPAVERIDRQIAVLEEFEQAYGEYLVERRSPDHDWSGEERARRERALKELAPQAEAAMAAAGARRWDEGPVRIDLPARILRFVDRGDGIDDDEQWKILEEMPTHIGALKGKRQTAADIGLKVSDTKVPPPVSPVPAASPRPKHRIVLTWIGEQAGKIAVTVIGGLILAGILFVLKG